MMMAPRQDVANAVHDYYLDLEERYLNGDLTLLAEIAANHDAVNAASSSPTATLVQSTTVPAEAAAALPVIHAAGAVANAAPPSNLPRKRKLEDLDPLERLAYDKGMAEIERMREESARMRDERKQSERVFAMQVLQDLKTLGMADKRDELRTADLLRNTALCPQSNNQILTMTPSSSQQPNINISTITAELGYVSTHKSDTAIGIALSNLYNKVHGERPLKVDVHCNGQVRKICNYSENDRDLMTQCIHDYFEKV
jgi:hypothetical protein